MKDDQQQMTVLVWGSVDTGGGVDVWFSPSRRVAVVAPRGELDLVGTEALRRALLQACEAERLVVVDLAEVSFLDSAALGVIVGATKRMQRRDANLQIVNADGEPLRAIKVTGLDILLAQGATSHT